MTPAQLDIARRLVAAPWFPTRGDGWTTRGDGNTMHFRDANGIGWVYDRLGEYVPDLRDAGTGGVLLEMLAAEVPALDVGYTGDGWWTRAWMGADWGPTCSGSTLAVVAASALLEVRGG